MAKIFFPIFLTVVAFALAMATSIQRDTTREASRPREEQGKAIGVESTDQDSSEVKSDMNFLELMDMCNESFRIEMEYLKALNETGSFIDESDRTPKCFIRCMLENTGILSDEGQFDTGRAAVVFAGERNGKPMGDLSDITAMCAMDRREKCRCERSYNFLRCLMSSEIEKFGIPTS